ncbi:MAG: GNAT family N-acetyltransferase, partial [Pseudomonadota bacterium]
MVELLKIRRATSGDHSDILQIILPVFRAGETYAVDPHISAEDAISYWTCADKTTFVAEADGKVL